MCTKYHLWNIGTVFFLNYEYTVVWDSILTLIDEVLLIWHYVCWFATKFFMEIFEKNFETFHLKNDKRNVRAVWVPRAWIWVSVCGFLVVDHCSFYIHSVNYIRLSGLWPQPFPFGGTLIHGVKKQPEHYVYYFKDESRKTGQWSGGQCIVNVNRCKKGSFKCYISN